MERVGPRSRSDTVAAPAQTRLGPPQPAHLTAFSISMPGLIRQTVIVPPVIERYPKILKWSGIALAVPGVLLCNRGYYVPGIALIGAGFGAAFISAFVQTFISEPRERFHIIDID
jgi:hypothetical protein